MQLLNKAIAFFKRHFFAPQKLLPVYREPLMLPAGKDVSLEKHEKPEKDVTIFDKKDKKELGWVNLQDIRLLKIWAVGIIADHARFDGEIPYDLTEQLKVSSRGNQTVLAMYAEAKEAGPIAVAEFFIELVDMCDQVLEKKKNQKGLGMRSPAARQNERIMRGWSEQIRSGDHGHD